MRIGILGSGDVGRALGKGFVKHGHETMLGSRDPKKKEVQEWLRETAGGQAGTFEETARFGDLVVLAVLGRIVDSVIKLAGPENLAGKTVIDTTNPIGEEAPVNGVLVYTTGPNESLGEQIQAKIPNARVVKAFNSVGNQFMVDPQFSGGLPTMRQCRSKGSSFCNRTTVWMGTSRLWEHHGGAGHRAAMYAVVYPRLPAERVEPRLQAAHQMSKYLFQLGLAWHRSVGAVHRPQYSVHLDK